MTPSSEDWMQAIGNILKTFHEQQRKETAKAYHFTRMTDVPSIPWAGMVSELLSSQLVSLLPCSALQTMPRFFRSDSFQFHGGFCDE